MKIPKIPSSWSGVPFKGYLQFMDLKEDSGFTDVISICSGIPRETLLSSKINNLEEVITALAFTKIPIQVDPKPTKVGKYNLPDNIILEHLGQFKDLMAIMESVRGKGLKEIVEAYPKYCAIYCQSINEPYNGEKALALVPEMMECPCTEIISAGSFFLVKLMTLSNNITASYQTEGQTQKKTLRGLMSYIKHLALGLRFRVWSKN